MNAADSDTNSGNAFRVPPVDRSNHRYLLFVKDLNDRAVACRREEDFRCAIKNYNEALSIDRESAVLYNNRGVVLLEQGEFDQAIADFSRAYRLLSRLVPSKSAHQSGSKHSALPFEEQNPEKKRGLTVD